jgi:anthranilate synthase component 2
VDVVRNNEITVAEIRKRNYNRIIISPGPGRPEKSAYFGVNGEVLTTLGKEIPILGVCLGMQGIAYYFGGKVVRAKKPMHGKTSIIKHDAKGVFAGLPQGLEVMRYHSLIVEASSLPEVLEVTAVVSEGKEISNFQFPISNLKEIEIMGIRHKKYPIEGIQFHPESFGTEGGKKMIENFLFQKVFKIKDQKSNI